MYVCQMIKDYSHRCCGDCRLKHTAGQLGICRNLIWQLSVPGAHCGRRVCFPRFIHSARSQEEDYFPRYTYAFLMPFSLLVHNFNHCIPNPPEPGDLYFVSGVRCRIIKHPNLSSLKPQPFYSLFMFLCIRSLGSVRMAPLCPVVPVTSAGTA